MHKIALMSLLFAPLCAFSQAAATDAVSNPKNVDPKIAEVMAELGKTKMPTSTQLSVDGKWIVWGEGGRLHLVKTSALGEEKLVAASEDCKLGAPSWSPESERLAYLSTCKGDAYSTIQVLKMDDATLTGKKLASPQGNISGLMQWSPDGKTLAFLFTPNATRSSGALDAMKPAVGVIGRDNFEVQNVSAVDVATGAQQEMTPASLYAYEFAWSPDSTRMVFVGAVPPGENNWWVAKIFVMPVAKRCAGGCGVSTAKEAPTVLVDPVTIPGPLHGLQVAQPRFSPNGKDIAFIGGLMSDFGSTGGDLYIVKAEGPYMGKDTHPFTAGRKASIAWFQWADPEHVLISERERGRVHIAMLGTGGEQSPFMSQYVDGTISSGSFGLAPSVSMMGHAMTAIVSSFDRAPEVYWGLPNRLKQVSHLNDGLKPAWGKAETVEWKNDGLDIQGYLLFPAHYDPAKKYPMITLVHGGPSSAQGSAWGRGGLGPEPFSAMGYFVFLPNPRGSYGQGEAFVQANRKDFGYGDLHDILAGIDVLEKKYPIDDNRLGLTGWSYGGFMTMFAVTQTNRFHAAMAGAGISNWLSYYGENSIDQWMVPFFGATVYDAPEVYARSSAMSFIKSVKTPVLVQVGERDGECPSAQSFEFWHGLRAMGVETELVVYPNEGHGFRDPAHRQEMLSRTLAWFEGHLK